MELTDLSSWLTVTEAAHRLGLCEDRVRKLIRDRKIRASKVGKWLIHPEDLASFVASRLNIQPCEGKDS